MTAADLLHEIHADGLQLALTERGNIAIKGANDQIEKWTPTIMQHKSELVEVLKTLADLEAAIHACCGCRGDAGHNRTALLADCWQEPATDWRWLIRHFGHEAERWSH